MSKIIKSRSASDTHGSYVIGIKNINNHELASDSISDANSQIIEEELQRIQKMREEAEAYSEHLKRESENMYNSALNQIEAERQQWEFEKTELIRTANEEGYTDGFKQGIIDGKESIRSKVEEANEIIVLAKADYEKTVAESEETILELALAISEKVIREKLDSESTLFLTFVKNAIKQLSETEQIKIKIAPSNYKLLISQKEELTSILTENQSLMILPNDELDEISCLIETNTGQIDISIDTQLSELKIKLLELLQGDD